MNVVQEIKRINKRELDLGLVNTSASWHTKYQNAAWVYIGNIPHELTEGDVICVFSQWGEVEDIHLVRDPETGKSRGFSFLKYYDSRSCVLAVDNFCGISLLHRTLRVDHVEQYRLPKHLQEKEETEGGKKEVNVESGHAYHGQDLANDFNIHEGQDLFARSSDKPTGDYGDYSLLPVEDNIFDTQEELIRQRNKKKNKSKSKDTKKRHKKHDKKSKK